MRKNRDFTGWLQDAAHAANELLDLINSNTIDTEDLDAYRRDEIEMSCENLNSEISAALLDYRERRDSEGPFSDPYAELRHLPHERL